MTTLTKRSMIYFDPAVFKALKLKSQGEPQSMSRIVHEALLEQLAQDEEDLKVFEERKDEPTISFEEVGRRLEKKWKSTKSTK